MKKRILALATLLGAVIWLIDTYIHYSSFRDEGTFLEQLLFAVPAHDLYTRIIVGFIIFVFGAFLARVLAQREAALRQASAAREDLKRLNDALETVVSERTADLEAANEAKTEFLTRVSHELRTPLNSIIGFAGIMQDELAGPISREQRKQLGMIRNSGTHLLELVNDILDISRLEAGQRDLSPEVISLGSLLHDAVGMLGPAAAEKGIELVHVCSCDEVCVETDERAVRQVVTNLLSNAIKFTSEGTIRIECGIGGDNGPFVVVEDTGSGIAEEDIEWIFDPFRQVGRAPQGEGTGLGLAISRQLARQLGGELTVESTLGEGSRFLLEIPDRVACP